MAYIIWSNSFLHCILRYYVVCRAHLIWFFIKSFFKVVFFLPYGLLDLLQQACGKQRKGTPCFRRNQGCSYSTGVEVWLIFVFFYLEFLQVQLVDGFSSFFFFSRKTRSLRSYLHNSKVSTKTFSSVILRSQFFALSNQSHGQHIECFFFYFRKDHRYYEELARTTELLSAYINGNNSDIRMLSEQTLDYILKVKSIIISFVWFFHWFKEIFENLKN